MHSSGISRMMYQFNFSMETSNFEINPKFRNFKNQILSVFENFDWRGSSFLIGDRNIIKIFDMEDGFQMNVKSFKIPNLINRVVYLYFRRSKAKRSYLFAQKLLRRGIDTPIPIAYLEKRNYIGLKNSYYASVHQKHDFTFRRLVREPLSPDTGDILRQFARFCYSMHEAGIEFKDHSPGNTLIEKINNRQYKFYLVDLNRGGWKVIPEKGDR